MGGTGASSSRRLSGSSLKLHSARRSMQVLHGNVPLQRRRPARQALHARDAWCMPLRDGNPSTTGKEPEPEPEAGPLPTPVRVSLALDAADVADAAESASAALAASSAEPVPESDAALAAAPSPVRLRGSTKLASCVPNASPTAELGFGESPPPLVLSVLSPAASASLCMTGRSALPAGTDDLKLQPHRLCRSPQAGSPDDIQLLPQPPVKPVRVLLPRSGLMQRGNSDARDHEGRSASESASVCACAAITPSSKVLMTYGPGVATRMR